MHKVFRKLFKKYNQQKISKEKRNIVDQWYDLQVKSVSEAPNEERLEHEMWFRILQNIDQRSDSYHLIRFLRPWVAAILLISGAGYALYYHLTTDVQSLDISLIEPASHQAIVSLSDERFEIEVDNQINLQAFTASQFDTDIVLSTPKGASFDLILPDGTKVFLNSDSKLRYPKAFTDSIRKVYIQGEAYFEVAFQASLPFIVQTDAVDIRVLGTKFNVRSYPDAESNAVSLLEGSVRLLGIHAETLLKPGELVHIDKGQLTFEKQSFGDYDPIAWKKGFFNFNNTLVSEISEDLSRWFNVDFDLSELNPDIRFTGRIPRQIALDSVLSHLSSTNELNFEVIKNKIKITSINN